MFKKSAMALVLILCPGLAVASNSIKLTVSLNSSDSSSLQDENIHLGNNTQTTDSDGWITYYSSFSTSDHAFSINCSERNVMGTIQNPECNVNVDSTISSNDSTKIGPCKIGSCTGVQILNSGDYMTLNTVLNGMGSFVSTEQVTVTMPDGTKTEYPKFSIDCDSASKTCQAVVSP